MALDARRSPILGRPSAQPAHFQKVRATALKDSARQWQHPAKAVVPIPPSPFGQAEDEGDIPRLALRMSSLHKDSIAGAMLWKLRNPRLKPLFGPTPKPKGGRRGCACGASRLGC